MWWFAALLFLLGFSALDMIVKSTGGPPTPRPPISTRSVVIEAVTSAQ